MNMRRFYLLVSTFSLFILFIAGFLMMNYLKAYSISGEDPDGGLFSDIITDIKTSSEPFNVLILGGDKVNQNTDTILLVNFNPSDCKTSIMSIPRDTRVKINGRTRKVNFAYHNGGANLAISTVQDLLDVNIKYYVYINISSFRTIIDILGGVDFYVPVDMDYDDPTQNLHIHLDKGQQHLNGAQAEQYMRFRQPNPGAGKEIYKYYDGTDMNRITAQQAFIKEFIKQKMNVYYLPRLNSIINTIFKNIKTNFTMSEILNLSNYIGKIKSEEINWFTLPCKAVQTDLFYYVINSNEASEITSEYFSAEPTQFNDVNNHSDEDDSEKPDNNSNNKNNGDNGKKNDNTQSTDTIDNPSNSESSLDGEQTPAP